MTNQGLRLNVSENSLPKSHAASSDHAKGSNNVRQYFQSTNHMPGSCIVRGGIQRDRTTLNNMQQLTIAIDFQTVRDVKSAVQDETIAPNGAQNDKTTNVFIGETERKPLTDKCELTDQIILQLPVD